MLTGKHQASSCAVTQNTCDQSLNSIEPTGKRLEESVNVGDNSSGKSIITGSQATHTAATNTCDRSSDAEDRVTGDVQDDKMDTTVRLSNDDVTNIPTHEGQKERIGEGGSLDGQSTNSVQDEPAVHDGMKQHEEMNSNPTAVKSYLRVLLKIFDPSITMSPTACHFVKNDLGPFKQLDSAPRSDESAKPSPTVVTCPHADSSSGSPRQSRYTDAVRDANKCSGNMNMEGTCEYERGTNTVTEEQNQTADPSLSGSAGSIRNDDIINTLPHGGQEEGMQVDDSSSVIQTSTDNQDTTFPEEPNTYANSSNTTGDKPTSEVKAIIAMTEGKSNSASVKCSNTDDDPTDEASFPPAQPNDEQSPGENTKESVSA